MKNVGQSPAVGTSVEAAIVLRVRKNQMSSKSKGKFALLVRPSSHPVSLFQETRTFLNEEYTVSISLPISRADIERSHAEMAEAHKDIRSDNFISPAPGWLCKV